MAGPARPQNREHGTTTSFTARSPALSAAQTSERTGNQSARQSFITTAGSARPENAGQQGVITVGLEQPRSLPSATSDRTVSKDSTVMEDNTARDDSISHSGQYSPTGDLTAVTMCISRGLREPPSGDSVDEDYSPRCKGKQRGRQRARGVGALGRSK